MSYCIERKVRFLGFRQVAYTPWVASCSWYHFKAQSLRSIKRPYDPTRAIHLLHFRIQ